MLQEMNQTESQELERTCQAVSPTDEPCGTLARHHCGICGQWFCSSHVEDKAWHNCVLEPGDDGGEG
jgi:hypothetical protein